MVIALLAQLIACSNQVTDKVEDPVVDTGDSAVDTDTGPAPVDEDGDGYTTVDDCDDTDPTVHPDAEEICDGQDNDCVASTPSDAAADLDADGERDCVDACPVYASPGATGTGTPTEPLGTLQEAVDEAGATGCNEVRAMPGTYEENVDWHGWPVNAESVKGAEETLLDGGGFASVVSFVTGESSDARIYGFTITNGGGGIGAGIQIREADPTIENNRIVGNTTSDLPGVGGGIRAYEASPTILDNLIQGNDAGFGGPEDGSDGGGINLRGGAATILGNVIVDNSAGDGGGIWTAYSDALIAQNIISGNIADDVPAAGDEDADGQGGGINIQVAGPAGPTIAGNIIADNMASFYGGGIVTYEDNAAYGEAEIVNNTIAFNSVRDTQFGAGFCQWTRTTPVFHNNLVYGNDGVGVYSKDDIDSTVTYNLVFGNVTAFGGVAGFTGNGTGNLLVDPGLTAATNDGDWTNDDFLVGRSSPAVDAGDPGVLDPDGSRSDIGHHGGPFGW
ncbi:MAG: hypothetical protein RLZZ383_24 [Pseudomonadota bacterium]